MTHATLVVELFTEELPPKALIRLSSAFSEAIFAGLRARGLVQDGTACTSYATPRRLAVSIPNVAARSSDQRLREKILPVSVALDAAGQASAPLKKKLAAIGLEHVELAQLERAADGKSEAFFYERTLPGKEIAAVFSEILAEAIARLPVPKVMSYQLRGGTPSEETIHFARPARSILALYGKQIIPCSALGLTSGRSTRGHRFLSTGAIDIPDAEDYESILRSQGKVIASFAERRARILAALESASSGAMVVKPDALLDEVTALVEWPVVYSGQFDAEFLEVPQECLLLTMQQNQRYFALTATSGKMQNRFLLVSNLETDDPSLIVHGNERVLRARLSDAKFFFDQDRKVTLESRVPALANIVYHNQLGSQRDRTLRMEAIAAAIAPRLGLDLDKVRRAIFLAKADLVTDMVGEFPELQGIMGRYYALNDHESADVADAIEDHYKPRYSRDGLPRDLLGCVCALADKLETVCAMFAIGNVPTGDRDPFGLRRHTVGILRILMEHRLTLSLGELIDVAFQSFAPRSVASDTRAALMHFIYERLRGLLRDSGYRVDEIESVVSLAPTRLDLLPAQLAAVRAFVALPEAQSLAAANKRISNILKKIEEAPRALNRASAVEPAERALVDVLEHIGPDIETDFDHARYESMLLRLAALKVPVDSFFTDVMVMADDPVVRANRIALLRELHRMMNRIADLSKLVPS